MIESATIFPSIYFVLEIASSLSLDYLIFRACFKTISSKEKWPRHRKRLSKTLRVYRNAWRYGGTILIY